MLSLRLLLQAAPETAGAALGSRRAVAAVHGYEGVLDALCAAGAQVGLKALHHATDMRSMQASGGSQAVQGRC